MLSFLYPGPNPHIMACEDPLMHDLICACLILRDSERKENDAMSIPSLRGSNEERRHIKEDLGPGPAQWLCDNVTSNRGISPYLWGTKILDSHQDALVLVWHSKMFPFVS